MKPSGLGDLHQMTPCMNRHGKLYCAVCKAAGPDADARVSFREGSPRLGEARRFSVRPGIHGCWNDEAGGSREECKDADLIRDKICVRSILGMIFIQRCTMEALRLQRAAIRGGHGDGRLHSFVGYEIRMWAVR